MRSISRLCAAVLTGGAMLAIPVAHGAAISGSALGDAAVSAAASGAVRPMEAEAGMLSEPMALVLLGGGMVAVALVLRRRGDRSG